MEKLGVKRNPAKSGEWKRVNGGRDQMMMSIDLQGKEGG